MFNLDDCIGFVTLRSGKVLSDTLEKDLAPFNITRAQWIAMYYIYNGDNITQRELADKSFFKRLRKRLGIAFATIGLASGSAAVAEINRQQEKSKDAQAEEVKTNDYYILDNKIHEINISEHNEVKEFVLYNKSMEKELPKTGF